MKKGYLGQLLSFLFFLGLFSTAQAQGDRTVYVQMISLKKNDTNLTCFFNSSGAIEAGTVKYGYKTLTNNLSLMNRVKIANNVKWNETIRLDYSAAGAVCHTEIVEKANWWDASGSAGSKTIIHNSVRNEYTFTLEFSWDEPTYDCYMTFSKIEVNLQEPSTGTTTSQSLWQGGIDKFQINGKKVVLNQKMKIAENIARTDANVTLDSKVTYPEYQSSSTKVGDIKLILMNGKSSPLKENIAQLLGMDFAMVGMSPMSVTYIGTAEVEWVQR